ncbi:response regulator transcription factor [Phytohabitans sp. ZYX-F-186]|uniref:Response regulator transcription factor n=1 Tax=Phytohabitans maris TaxID=3071409 RepID=A0ABU0ZDE9_9ACTN|nr:response regulator transcription factor [Phytohabitans sp. ZYX-F-186]MDQ7905080.1 response regulator transcription factor [Phytohabitans sp. ZYX-F-186]
MEAVGVAVLAGDQLTRDGVVAGLASQPAVEVYLGERQRSARVLLAVADQVTDEVLGGIERFGRAARQRDPAVVLVANELREYHVLRAVELGLAGLLHRRDAGFEQIARAVVAAASGRAELPAAVTRRLLEQMRAVQRDVLGPRGLTVSGFTDRELEVLRLLAEGLDTGEVALKLNYSQRTVKNIIYGVMTRFGLRNRTHAVAYAIRTGALRPS